MFKDFILLFLVAAVSSKTVLDSTIIDFDVNQPFTPDNHEFTFSNDALESKFYIVDVKVLKKKVVKHLYILILLLKPKQEIAI